ncbi:MAG: sigma-54-dependent Fis family transcriptional regulator [Cohaesibacteraceae bacterium]|nr:sigma-54-dependent Fis family transcriptional regulator [Cohaesibacteraceae bacterium]
MRKEPQILLVEPSASQASWYIRFLDDADFPFEWINTVRDLPALLLKYHFQVILFSTDIDQMSASEFLCMARKKTPSTRLIIISRIGSIRDVVQFMRQGAFDFIVQPANETRIIGAVTEAVKSIKPIAQKTSVNRTSNFGNAHGFIGSCSAIKTVYETISRVSGSRAPVFIEGENGTGKELCAHAIHNESDRSRYSFVALNCASIPSSLMESELFGHRKGAFTGATENRDGAVLTADKGTLFLDEICEMHIDLQAKLLRFLQDGEIKPVGGDQIVKTDVRIICATNKDPLIAIDQGLFRNDLYYRLYVVPLILPPLRERNNDILRLAKHFLQQINAAEHADFSGFGPRAQQLLLHYAWPGNVRELENIIWRTVILNDGSNITSSMLPEMMKHTQSVKEEGPTPDAGTITTDQEINLVPSVDTTTLYFDTESSLDDIERKVIRLIIDKNHGSVPASARSLQVSPSTLYRKLENWTNNNSPSDSEPKLAKG